MEFKLGDKISLKGKIISTNLPSDWFGVEICGQQTTFTSSELDSMNKPKQTKKQLRAKIAELEAEISEWKERERKNIEFFYPTFKIVEDDNELLQRIKELESVLNSSEFRTDSQYKSHVDILQGRLNTKQAEINKLQSQLASEQSISAELRMQRDEYNNQLHSSQLECSTAWQHNHELRDQLASASEAVEVVRVLEASKQILQFYKADDHAWYVKPFMVGESYHGKTLADALRAAGLMDAKGGSEDGTN